MPRHPSDPGQGGRGCLPPGCLGLLQYTLPARPLHIEVFLTNKVQVIHRILASKNFRLGLSSGCAVTPFPQSSSPSLPTVICSVLLACRQEGITAGVDRIREGVRRALPCLEDQQLASVVHRTLRSLIKVIFNGIGNFLTL